MRSSHSTCSVHSRRGKVSVRDQSPAPISHLVHTRFVQSHDARVRQFLEYVLHGFLRIELLRSEECLDELPVEHRADNVIDH